MRIADLGWRVGPVVGIIALVAVAANLDKIRARFGPVAQCPADYYECGPTNVKICTPGTVAKGCEYVGNGQSDCRLVKDCK